MSRYQKYPAYKDSGVEWIGEIPEHWTVWKVTHGFKTIGSGTTPKSDNPEYYDGDIHWVTTSELRESKILDTSQKVSKKALNEYSALKIYSAGSIAIAMYGATIGRLGILGINATVNQACCVFSKPTVFDPLFLYYWLQMRKPILLSLSTGGGQPNLSQDDLKQLRIPIPPINEQKGIVSFLNRKTAEIDELISKKEELLKQLDEKRSTLITQAVTKGIDPTLPMKDSGIAWLGVIPTHWGITALHHITMLKSGESIIATMMDENEEFPVYGGNGFRGYYSGYTHNGDYILIGRQGALCGNINYASGKFWASEHAIVLTPTKAISTTWLGELLKAMNLNQYSVSAAQPGLSAEAIGRLKIPLPPFEEQQAIAEEIEKKTATIDRQKAQVTEAVELLKEYRSALITDAVTGKMDVHSYETKESFSA